MTLNLTRRSVKGQPLDAVDHDTNLDKIEQAIETIELTPGPPGADGDGTAYYGQISRQTSGTVAVAATDTFYPINLAGTLDAANSFGMVTGTNEQLALKNNTGEPQLFTVIGTADVRAANNQVLGLRLAVQGVTIAATECRVTTGTTNYGKLLSQWIVELANGEEVSLHVANHSGTTNITVDRAKVVAFTAGRQGEQGDPGPQPDLSSATPQPLGIAAAGTSTTASRSDHVHAMPSAADVGAATAAQGSLADTAVQPGSLATVATSGAYNDLSGRPTLGTAAAANTGDFATAAQGAKADTAVQPGALGNSAGLNVGTTTGTVAAGDDSRITGALSATDAATTYQPLDSDLTAIAALTTTTFGRELLTQADAAATRTTIGAGTSSVAISSATPQPLGTAAAGATGQAADAGHVHASPPLVSTSTAGLALPTGFGTITYASTVDLDLAVLTGQVNTITLTGPLTLTTSNLANGRVTGLRLIPGASARDLTFPADWKFVSAKPASLPANKIARLTIEAHGTTNADVIAAIAIQP